MSTVFPKLLPSPLLRPRLVPFERGACVAFDLRILERYGLAYHTPGHLPSLAAAVRQHFSFPASVVVDIHRVGVAWWETRSDFITT